MRKLLIALVLVGLCAPVVLGANAYETGTYTRTIGVDSAATKGYDTVVILSGAAAMRAKSIRVAVKITPNYYTVASHLGGQADTVHWRLQGMVAGQWITCDTNNPDPIGNQTTAQAPDSAYLVAGAALDTVLFSAYRIVTTTGDSTINETLSAACYYTLRWKALIRE